MATKKKTTVETDKPAKTVKAVKATAKTTAAKSAASDNSHFLILQTIFTPLISTSFFNYITAIELRFSHLKFSVE